MNKDGDGNMMLSVMMMMMLFMVMMMLSVVMMIMLFGDRDGDDDAVGDIEEIKVFGRSP